MNDSDVEIVEMTPEEEEAFLHRHAVVGPWSEGLFDIDYPFEVLREEARARGFIKFATQTEERDGKIWRSRVVFLKRES